jgi:hypothetical protein
MSIISDALQKAGQEKKTNSEHIAEPAFQSVIDKPQEKIIKSTGKRWIYFIGFITLLTSILIILTHAKKDSAKNTEPVPQAAALPAIPAPEVISQKSDEKILSEPINQNEIPKAPEFKLTGIVFGEGSPMAIINGSVYMKNDEIEGFKITDIKKDTVSVERNGTIIELQVR